MNEIDRLRELDRARERSARPPKVDATAAILRAIREAQRESRQDDRFLAIAAGVSVVVGAAAVAVAIALWGGPAAASDPAATLAEPFRWVLP